MLPFFFSVLVSALLVGGSLFITRQRLGRQFEDIQRRQIEIERNVSGITRRLENSTADAQLLRLHLGLVRLQENIARRHAEEIKPGRTLSDLQVGALRQWSARFGAELDEREIVGLAQDVARAESLEPRDLAITTTDILAGLISISDRRGSTVSIGLKGRSFSDSFAAVLPRVLSSFSEQASVSKIAADPAGTPPLDLLVFDEKVSLEDLTPALELVKPGGVAWMHVTEDPEIIDFPSFELVGAEWNSRVYRRTGLPA